MTLSSIYGELSPINYFRKKALLVDDLQGPKYVSTYLEPSRTFTMKIFCENGYGFKPFAKSSIIDLRLGLKYAFGHYLY